MSVVELQQLYVDGQLLAGCRSAGLVIEAERIEVASMSGHTVPDPRWTQLDKAGHWHAAATRRPLLGGETVIWYPTLEEHVEVNPAYDPDDPDPDWTINAPNLRWWRCAICHERVDPRTITSHERQYVAGREDWRITVEVADDRWWAGGAAGALYTVRGVSGLAPSAQHPTPGGREWFGVARWHPGGLSTGGDEMSLLTGTFEGVGELGQRVG
jgi:hypothetical protein